ncbi:hypothetical protein [Aeromonas veronii]|uniref:hypothetical protein n=2 Tax=Aeromonas veronii TaxID=654 RepID=UPI003BA23101
MQPEYLEAILETINFFIENWKDAISILALAVAIISAVAALKSASAAEKSDQLAENQQKLIIVQSISSSLQAICHGVYVAKEMKKSLDFSYVELAVWTGQVGSSRFNLAKSKIEERVSELLPLEDIALEKLSQIASLSNLSMVALISEQANYEVFNQSVARENMFLNKELNDVMQAINTFRSKV